MTDIKTVLPTRSEIVSAAIADLNSAFIDVTLHAQTAFKLVAYIKELEAAVLAASAPAQEPVADEFHRHEVLDRTHVIQTMLNELLDEHPGMTPELTALYEKSVRSIHDLYQAAGNVRFAEAPKACGNCKHGSRSPTDECETCFSDPQSMLNNKLQNWEPIIALQASQSPQDQVKL